MPLGLVQLAQVDTCMHGLVNVRCPHPNQDALRKTVFNYTEAVCNASWSIRRLSEHRMVSGEVYDGQDPTRST